VRQGENYLENSSCLSKLIRLSQDTNRGDIRKKMVF